jgi:hypothetical protein
MAPAPRVRRSRQPDLEKEKEGCIEYVLNELSWHQQVAHHQFSFVAEDPLILIALLIGLTFIFSLGGRGRMIECGRLDITVGELATTVNIN